MPCKRASLSLSLSIGVFWRTWSGFVCRYFWEK
jgi:hypothetical protein